jgi:hypothetical protein
MPWAMYYDTDPAHATYLHRFIANVLGFKNFRRMDNGKICYRLVTVIGTCQPVEDLPSNPDEGTTIMFRRCERLRQHAEEHATGRKSVAAPEQA